MNENSKGDDEDGDNAPPDMYYMLNGSGGNYDYWKGDDDDREEVWSDLRPTFLLFTSLPKQPQHQSD